MSVLSFEQSNIINRISTHDKIGKFSESEKNSKTLPVIFWCFNDVTKTQNYTAKKQFLLL